MRLEGSIFIDSIVSQVQNSDNATEVVVLDGKLVVKKSQDIFGIETVGITFAPESS